MTDTPRTLAELDALYADNNAGAISAQDLRDGFHSVAAPVSGGGLQPKWQDYETDTLYYTAQSLTTPLPFPASTITKLVLDPVRPASFLQTVDPLGMAFQGPWDYYGTQPEWGVFGVPPGLWRAEVFITTAAGGDTTTGKRYVSLSPAEATWDEVGNPEAFFGDPIYQNPVIGSLNTQYSASSLLIEGGQQRVAADGTVWVPTTGTVGGGRSAFYFWAYQTSGTALGISDYGLTLRRVG